MTTDRGALAALLATMMLSSAASPALAQTEQTTPVRGLEGLATPGAQTPSSSTSAAIPIPDAPKIVLPDETAPRRSPRARAAGVPAAERTTEGRVTRTEPAARTRNASESAQSSTAAEPSRVPTSVPEPTGAPVSAPTTETSLHAAVPQSTAPQPTVPQAAAPEPEPTTGAVTTPQPTLSAPETGRAMPLWLSLAVIVVVLGGLWLLRRNPRGGGRGREEAETVVAPSPEPTPLEPTGFESTAAERVSRTAATDTATAAARPAQPTVTPITPVDFVPATAAPKFLEPRAKTPPPPPAVPRARITCDLRPLRAGLNLLSATVECELVVTNTGAARADAIRTGVALLTAHTGQDTDLAQFNAAPIGRPASPPFALAPGETRTIRTVTAIARDAIQTMTAANRPMFVPVVATNILYTTAGEDAQTARAWSIGIERVDSAKLAPFWLDAPARMFTTVAARPHAATFDR